MKTKREKMERAYSAVAVGSLIVGVLVLAFCVVCFIFAEVVGRNAMMNPGANNDLLTMVRALAFGMLSSLGVAALLASHTMWRYRKMLPLKVTDSVAFRQNRPLK